ncbi:hypothetical protein GCM10023264_21640 [Sphingomonas daechungensis]
MRFFDNAARAGFLLAVCIAAPAAAQTKTETVNFPRGKTNTTLIGSIKGDVGRDYLVRAAGGQTLRVVLSSANKSTYFNVLPPGSNDEAIFIGSTSGDSFSGVLPQSGTYKVRVYLMRNAARENQSSLYTLKVGLTGASTGSSAVSGGAGKEPIDDLAGMDAIRAIDVMAERGFNDVDSFESGDTRYGIFYRPSSRQCVQLTFANNRVEAANDIGTHPKCK